MRHLVHAAAALVRSAFETSHRPALDQPDSPAAAYEAIALQVLRRHGPLALDALVDHVAEQALRTEQRQAGWILDVGLWGPEVFRREAARAVRQMIGASLVMIELDHSHGGIVKVNPLADWREAQVWAYMRAHEVPSHPLYDQGYQSIGCAPCTRPVAPGESARAGRWWWETDAPKECGIHCAIELAGAERPR